MGKIDIWYFFVKLEKSSKFIGSNPYIQQSTAANLFSNSYTEMLNTAASEYDCGCLPSFDFSNIDPRILVLLVCFSSI